MQIKDVQTLASKMLKDKKYTECAILLRKSLSQFPGNAELLDLKKQLVTEDYRENVLKASEKYNTSLYFDKKPDPSKCEPGIVSRVGHADMLARMIYARRLAGIYDSCAFDPDFNSKCQKAALMMDANDKLDHAPTIAWKCYSKEGMMAAGCSNLSLGYSFTEALMGQLLDDGSGNTACGHRRWILNPHNTVFGHGSTENAMSLGVFGTGNSKLQRKITFNDSQFVSWPAADYFPADLVPLRWSFSLEKADFKQAKVEVRTGNKMIRTDKETVATGFGLNTIVWTLNEKPQAGKTYIVTISNVLLGRVRKSFTYNVSLLDIK